MKHLNTGEISDFVRGITEPHNGAEVTAHLDSCSECEEAATFYRKVHRSALQPAIPLPQDVVNSVKSLFRELSHQTQSPVRLSHVIANLFFPQSGEWALAGVRSAIHSGTARHAVYKSANFFIDLRTELQADSELLSLVGQISNKTSPLAGTLESSAVRIISGARTICETQFNSLGEFSITFMPGPRIQLEIDLPSAETRIRIPLNKLIPQVPIS